jgi:hypothetical protein
MGDLSADAALKLAECLTTRLCHDVAGLVATLSGTLEMALEDGGGGEAADLASEAAAMLAARVRLFRAGWGGGDLERSNFSALAGGLPGRGKLSLDLAGLENAHATGALAEGGARLVLCLLLAACAGLPFGGQILGMAAPGGGFTLAIAGRNAAWPSGLTGGHEVLAEASPSLLAAPMAAMVAAGLGWRLDVDGAVLRASPG